MLYYSKHDFESSSKIIVVFVGWEQRRPGKRETGRNGTGRPVGKGSSSVFLFPAGNGLGGLTGALFRKRPVWGRVPATVREGTPDGNGGVVPVLSSAGKPVRTGRRCRRVSPSGVDSCAWSRRSPGIGEVVRRLEEGAGSTGRSAEGRRRTRTKGLCAVCLRGFPRAVFFCRSCCFSPVRAMPRLAGGRWRGRTGRGGAGFFRSRWSGYGVCSGGRFRRPARVTEKGR